MADYAIISTNLLRQIGNAIRKMRGTTENIPSTRMPEEIESIQTGHDVSGVTASASDVLSGKVFVDASGQEQTGTIATKTASNLSASGATVTVPAGYYAAEATKSVSTVTQATPTISVSSAGVVTASVTQSTGYVSGGTKSKTYTLSSSNDSDFKASNIKSGVTIFGVTGTYVPTFS